MPTRPARDNPPIRFLYPQALEIQEIAESEKYSEKISEFGDLLFALVNVARWLEIDAESALRGANRRFKERFAYVEQKARADGRELSDMTLEDLDHLWEQAKNELDL